MRVWIDITNSGRGKTDYFFCNGHRNRVQSTDNFGSVHSAIGLALTILNCSFASPGDSASSVFHIQLELVCSITRIRVRTVVTVPVQGLRPRREMHWPTRTHALSVTVISLSPLTIYPLHLILMSLSLFKFEIHGRGAKQRPSTAACLPSCLFCQSFRSTACGQIEKGDLGIRIGIWNLQ